MKITLEKLKELKVFHTFIDMFEKKFPDGAEFKEIIEHSIENGEEYINFAIFLAPRVLRKIDSIRYGVFAAREVLPIFEKMWPEEKTPRNNIEEAEEWLENPCYHKFTRFSGIDSANRSLIYAEKYADSSFVLSLKVKMLRYAVELFEKSVSVVKTNQYIDIINDELKNATKKHPLFCHAYANSEKESISRALASIRSCNEFCEKQGKKIAATILQEEILEAEEAFLSGDFDSCLHELAQSGAVILRMMELVETEKRKTLEKGV